MSIGTASIPAPVGAILLAALIVSIHGCDGDTAKSQVTDATGTALQTREQNARHRSDPKHNRAWSLTPEGVSVRDIAAPESVDVPLPGWQWVDASYACPPDLALGPDGVAVITSNVVPTLWRIDPATLTVTVHPLALDADTNKDVGFSALTYSPEHAAYFAVSEVHGSLWRIDRPLAKARKLRLSGSLPQWCGVTLRRITQEKAGRHISLCMSGREGSRTIDIAPDASYAYVRAVACADGNR